MKLGKDIGWSKVGKGGLLNTRCSLGRIYRLVTRRERRSVGYKLYIHLGEDIGC